MPKSEFSKELVSPNGRKYVATSQREANDLIYGAGYREAETEKTKSSKTAKSDSKSEETT
jgi:hypothetical protein